MLILRPTAKLSHFCAHMFLRTHSQLVSLQDVFPSGCAVFKVHSGILRSLKTIQVQEEEQSTAKLFAWSFSHLHLAVYRPEMKRSDFSSRFLPRKEVIQPHLPIRLPCYDFTPVIGLALDGWLLAVASPALGTPNSHGVTGGVYKARERIHRGMLIRDY